MKPGWYYRFIATKDWMQRGTFYIKAAFKPTLYYHYITVVLSILIIMHLSDYSYTEHYKIDLVFDLMSKSLKNASSNLRYWSMITPYQQTNIEYTLKEKKGH